MERKPRGYWTKEQCSTEAQKYEKRNDFQTYCKPAYTMATRNGWLDEICSHMAKGYHKHGHWTLENCRAEALKYQTRNEFRKGSKWAARVSDQNNWFDEICSHMKKVGNKMQRCVYVFEFSDNHAYVGLTFNYQKREKERLQKSNSSVYKHIQQTGLTPKFILLTEYVNVNDAATLEESFYQSYITKGWVMLNVKQTGGLGGLEKWTKDLCANEAIKYMTRKEYRDNCPSYWAAYKKGWFSEITQHMPIIPTFRTIEDCKAIALQCKSKSEFYRLNINAYNKCVRKGWIKEVCAHMKKYQKE